MTHSEISGNSLKLLGSLSVTSQPTSDRQRHRLLMLCKVAVLVMSLRHTLHEVLDAA